MVETITLLLMMVFAYLAIHASLMRMAIIYLAAFSVVAAFLYLLFAAPELALAEAAIGSGLVTLLYLAALKRNKVYTIAVLAEGHRYRSTDAYIGYVKRLRAIREIRRFFEQRELEPQFIFSEKDLGDALAYPGFDLVICEEKDRLTAHGSADSFVLEELEMMFQIHGTLQGVEIIRHETVPAREAEI